MTTQQGTSTTTETTQGKKQGQAKQDEAAKKTERKPREKKEKPVRETPAHMSKIEKVAAGLPSMSKDVQVLYAAATNMSTADIVSLIAHLDIARRKRGVQQAATLHAQGRENPSRELKVGMRVKVVSSQNPRFVGAEGTVSKVQRIRCYVELDGREYSEKEDGKGIKFKGDYFFTSDVIPVSASAQDLGPSLQETVLRLTSQAGPALGDTLADEEMNELEQELNAKTG